MSIQARLTELEARAAKQPLGHPDAATLDAKMREALGDEAHGKLITALAAGDLTALTDDELINADKALVRIATDAAAVARAKLNNSKTAGMSSGPADSTRQRSPK